MAKKNIFEGDSSRAIFCRLIYNLLKKRQLISHSFVMKEAVYWEEKTKNKAMTFKVSREVDYGELKKAFMDIKKVLLEREQNCLEIIGNNRNQQYRYVGKADGPLDDMLNASIISDLKTYWKFCQDSAGFFPTSWLNHFFKGTQDLLDIKTSRSIGQQYIYSSVDRELDNIDLLPEIYDYIKRKKVLKIEYSPFYEDVKTVIFHPHLLKEYNGRWHVFGYSEELNKLGSGVPIDRIINKIEVVNDITYVERPVGFYEDIFKYLIGLTVKEHEKVTIRAHSKYFWGLFDSKPLPNQKVVKEFGKHEDGEYGDFEIEVTINDEFFGRILLFSPNIEIISPKSVREKMAERVKNTNKLYN